MKHKLKILIAFTSICLIAFAVVMIMMIKENGQCVDSPFEYSAMRLKESGGNYACSCSSLDPKLADFTFNEDGIEISNSNSYTRSNPVNYDKFNKFNFSNIQFID